MKSRISCSVLLYFLSFASSAFAQFLTPSNPALVKQLQHQVKQESAAQQQHQASGVFRPEYLTSADEQRAGVRVVEGDIEADSKHLPFALRPVDIQNLAQDAVRDTNKLWPGGRIPYMIHDMLTYAQKQIVKIAMGEYERNTCIRWMEKTDNDAQYVLIRQVHLGCYSKVGYEGDAVQRISFHPSCFEKLGTIMHELMHTVGFYHEQSRLDRDDWVKIEFDNVIDMQRPQFQKIAESEIDDHGKPYDYGSIMHYQDDAFTKTAGLKTIIALKPLDDGVKLGQREYFSSLDIEKINNLYNCTGPAAAAAPAAGSPGESPSSPGPAATCSQQEVACAAGGSVNCGLPCDGIAQCSDGSDESAQTCPPPRCRDSDMFACKIIKCIPKSWLCDGSKDCPGGEDEAPENCHQRTCSTQNEFDCGGKCIPVFRVCDGVSDCIQGQDEEPTMRAQKKQQQQQQQQPSQPPPPPVDQPTEPATEAPPPATEAPQQPQFQLQPCRIPQQQQQQQFFGGGGGFFMQQPQQQQQQQYQCANGFQCFSQQDRCNGYWTCTDGSDEAGCYPNQQQQQQPQTQSTSLFPSNNPFVLPSPARPRPQQQQPFVVPNNNPYFSFYQPQPFGQSLQSFFNPYYGPGFGWDAGQKEVQTHCFINTASFDLRPEIRLTPNLVEKLFNGSDDSSDTGLNACRYVTFGFARINPDALTISFAGSAAAQQTLKLMQTAAEDQRIVSFLIAIGGTGPNIEALRTIGNNVTRAQQFARNVRQQLRVWKATGLVLEWLRPTSIGVDRTALNTLVKTLAEAMQFDPVLSMKKPTLPPPQQRGDAADNKKKQPKIRASDASSSSTPPPPPPKRLLLGMNVVNSIQPGHDQPLLLNNVDFFNILPDPLETMTSPHTFYTNRLLMSVAENNNNASSSNHVVVVMGSQQLSNTWLSSADNITMQRFNIGIRLSPLTWTLDMTQKSKASGIAPKIGAETNAPGLPGPFTGTSGMLNYGEVCVMGKAARLQQLRANGYHALKALKFGVDPKQLKSAYAYSLPESQWISYETPESLAAKLTKAKLAGRFNGVYVVDAHNDDVRGLCTASSGAGGGVQKLFPLMNAIANATLAVAVSS